MKDTTWKKRLKRLMTEAEMPLYPDAPVAVPSNPVTTDTEVIRSLLNWSAGATPEEVDRAVAKIEDIAVHGGTVDSTLVADITTAGDYEMPGTVAQPMPPVDVAPVEAPVPAMPIDIAPPEGDMTTSAAADVAPADPMDAPVEEPIEDIPVDGEEEVVDDLAGVEGEPTAADIVGGEEDEMIVPSADEDEEEFEEEAKQTFFKSFFDK